ncbi:uncharacterized protein LOC123259752 [Cotesia glomerata]|uniref:uncharacterized protein LOC123258892 n=1 Tax=Cotesia glomerata TaxID=32391 RepID=UPI001D035057|nr:uncharacterized protein LOC123258892 [Cotesia glomerata]XP_044576367.1 uncharacterized protein LOC123259752 [Cotesia glomerata]
MPKTNAEMCRQYRRKKNEIKMKKNSAKSSTERSREFRARKKQLLNNQNRCSDISVNVTDVINDRRASVSTIDLQHEFRRLNLNRLETITNVLYDFLNKRKGMSLFTFNCQSLRAHVQDLQHDNIVSSSNFLILSETWMNNEDIVDIPNFNIVVNYKDHVRGQAE